MHNDFHFISSIPEETLRVLVAYIPRVVIADLGDDVPPLKHPISGGTKPYLTQTHTHNQNKNFIFFFEIPPHPLTFVTIKGAFASAPPTKLKPHGVEGELRRNITRSSLVRPPIIITFVCVVGLIN